MRFIRLIIIALVVFVLAGCGKRKAAPDVDLQGEYMLMSEYYALLGDSAEMPQWHDIYVPFKLNLYVPTQVTLSGRATMVRDSAIYLSIRVMGIEGAVALITADSVFVHDKYHKIYIADEASAIFSGIGLLPAQAALLGQPFEPGPRLDSICWVLPSVADDVIESLSFDLPGGAQAYCAYGQWTPTDCGMLAGQCDVLGFASALSESPSVQASVEWSLGNAKFDTGRAVKFKPPKDLEPLRISDLAPLLMDMQ